MSSDPNHSSSWTLLTQGAGRYVLYGKPGTISAVPQMILEEIGAPYDLKQPGSDDVDTVEYRALNPLGRVPTLVFPSGVAVFETAAICMVLAAAHPKAGLAPAVGTADAAKLAQWLVFMSSSLYETSRRGYRAREMSVDGEAAAGGIKDRARVDQLELLKVLDATVAPYLIGKQYTVADPYLYQLTRWFLGPPEELRCLCPALARHADLVAVRPAIARVIAQHAH